MKNSEIKDLSESDIMEKLIDERKALADLKFQHSVSSVENPAELAEKKKNIARMLTELSARKNNTNSES
jgi:large subunit ribosomal protein L29